MSEEKLEWSLKRDLTFCLPTKKKKKTQEWDIVQNERNEKPRMSEEKLRLMVNR
jgi:hypothetical protein